MQVANRDRPEYFRLRWALAVIREECGLTQSQLAERLHRSQTWVSKVELGEIAIDVVDLLDFAGAFGLALDEILDRADIEHR